MRGACVPGTSPRLRAQRPRPGAEGYFRHADGGGGSGAVTRAGQALSSTQGGFPMNAIRHFALAACAAVLLAAIHVPAQAQVAVDIGPEPACPYGFYDYAPYACAPAGYYGPEWFVGGVFI